MNIKNVELRHLRYFIGVAEALHFGRAAEKLGIAQAPLSQQIQQLEERLGVRLFDRTTRQVKLSQAGAVFLEHARRTLLDLESGVEAARTAVGNELGRLRIASVYVALNQVLPQSIRQFRKRYPQVEIDIRVGSTEQNIALMERGEADVAFVRPPKSVATLSVERLLSEGMVAVLPRTHRLASQANLTLLDLREEDFLINSPLLGAGYQDVILQHCRLAGFRPRIAQQVSESLAIVTLVAAGIGIGVVPEWVRQMPNPEVIYRPLSELPAAVDLALAWPSDAVSRLVRHFVTVTREVARSGSRNRR